MSSRKKLEPRKSSPRIPRAKTAGVKKPVINQALSSTRRSSARLADKLLEKTVTVDKDGLVDLRKTSERITTISQRNAVRSPLLQLPAELRDMIWTFAMGGNVVWPPEFSRSGQPCAKGGSWPTLPAQTKAQTAFHLPEVSRQIYAETAKKAYQTNTFWVEADRDLNSRSWQRVLSLAQRQAIVSIKPDTDTLRSYLIDKNQDNIFKKSFPNLRNIDASYDGTYSEVGLWWWWWAFTCLSRDDMTQEEWESKLASKVKAKEGTDVEIYFKYGVEGIDGGAW